MIRGKDPRSRREDGWPSHAERTGDRAGSDSSKNKKKEQTRKIRTRQGDKRKETCLRRAEEPGAGTMGTLRALPMAERKPVPSRSEVNQQAQRKQTDISRSVLQRLGRAGSDKGLRVALWSGECSLIYCGDGGQL